MKSSSVELDAHLDAQIVVVVHVPRARVADDLAVARLHEQRALPERLRAAASKPSEVKKRSPSFTISFSSIFFCFRISRQVEAWIRLGGSTIG